MAFRCRSRSSFWKTPAWLFFEARQNCSPAYANCWKCGKTITFPESTVLFFCPCNEKVVLPPIAVNYFKIFGRPQTYSINLLQLKQKYVELQRKLHPDKYSNKSQVEKNYALQQSSLVNKAYGTLSLPYERGIYMLELLGIPMNEDEDTTVDDLEFLEEVMDINETLVNLSENDYEMLGVLKKKAGDYLQQSVELLGKSFDKGKYLQAKETLKRMKYYINIKEKIHYIHQEE